MRAGFFGYDGHAANLWWKSARGAVTDEHQSAPKLTAHCGARYRWIAAKTCVNRAISKEVPGRAGFISCLDYHNERHALKLYWTAVCRTACMVVWGGERISSARLTDGFLLITQLFFFSENKSDEVEKKQPVCYHKKRVFLRFFNNTPLYNFFIKKYRTGLSDV